MALKIDKAQLQIEILQDTAMQNLKNLETQIRTAKTEMNKLKQGTDEYRQAEEKVKQLNNTYQELTSKINISEMPMSMLIKRQRELNAALREMRPNSASYQNFRNELDATNKRILELKGKAVDTGFSLTKVADGMNKYAVLASGVAASLTGITLTAKKCVDAYADMQEAEAQVIKYTGMTQQEVDELNEDFKKMDTRTSREQLNALAGQAGQLGITSKKSIEDFVDAADKINVALGQELGQDAVKTIGRLAMMFGEDKTKGLRGAMLATGSAVNQLAQSVGSDADYLVDFLSRVAGVSKLANISQANIIGYASVLNLNRQQVEMAATAFQTLLLKMYQDPAKFAKLAGQDVKQFTHLLKTDANEAILRFMTILKGQGGFDKIAPLFKDMGLDGVRASGVLSTLAGKIADVRKQQQISNQAYKDGTSAIQEFNVQNNTVKAGFEKAKKHILDITVDLGKKLQPAMTDVLTKTGAMIKILGVLIDFILNNKLAIISTATAWGTYVVSVKVATVVENLHNLSIKRTIVSIRNLWRAITANPMSLLIALAAGAGVAYIKFAASSSAADEGQRKMNASLNATKGHYDTLQKTIGKYLPIAQDAKRSTSERNKAIQTLKGIMPNYFKDLDLESTKLYSVANAAEAVTKAYHIKIRMQAISANRDYDSAKNMMDSKDSEMKNNSTIKDQAWYNSYMIVKKQYQAAQAEKKAADMAVVEINKQIREAAKKKNQSTNNSSGGSTVKSPGKKKNEKKTNPEAPYKIDTRNLEAEHTQQLNALKKYALDNNQTEAEYNLANIEENRNFYEKKYVLTQKYLQKTKDKKMKSDLNKDEQDTLSQLLDIDKQMGDARIKVAEEQRDRELDNKQDLAEKTKLSFAHMYADGKISESEYNMYIASIDENSKDERLKILTDYAAKVQNLEIKNGQDKLKAVNEANRAVVQADMDASTERAKTEQTVKEAINNFQKQFGVKQSPKDDYQERLKEIDDFYKAQLILLQKHNIDTTNLEKAQKLAIDLTKDDYTKAILDIKEQFGIDTTKERHNLELKELEDFHNQGLMSEKEYNDAKKKLDKKYDDGKKLDFEKTMKFIQELAGNVSSAVQGFAEAETITSDAKYDKQITAAKKAGKDTTKLEEQKEAAQNKIKKKYADIQFAAAVLQIGSTTAVTAMEAYKALAGISGVGPVLGAAAAAAAVLAGAAQIKVAKANRDAAKGLYTGGFSNDYVEGYTGTGNSHDVAGAIPVHKNEWVANHEAVANPHVRKFLDVFNIAQRNGTINMLDTTAILQQLQLTGGKYSGGYTDTPSGTVTTQHISVNAGYAQLTNDMQEVKKLLAVIAGKKITLAMTDVRDKLNELNTYESNASR